MRGIGAYGGGEKKKNAASIGGEKAAKNDISGESGEIAAKYRRKK